MSEGCIKKYQERPELRQFCGLQKGAKHSDETRAKMREAWERRRLNEDMKKRFDEAMAKKCKKVYCFDLDMNFVREFSSLTEAGPALGGRKGGAGQAIKVGRPYKGYYLSYTSALPLVPAVGAGDERSLQGEDASV